MGRPYTADLDEILGGFHCNAEAHTEYMLPSMLDSLHLLCVIKKYLLTFKSNLIIHITTDIIIHN